MGSCRWNSIRLWVLLAMLQSAPVYADRSFPPSPTCNSDTDYVARIDEWKEAHLPQRASAVDRPARDPGLRDRLLRMRDRDQKAREGDTLDWQRMRVVDQSNTDDLLAIVDQHGWPTEDLVGEDGADAAWLIVQHAPDIEVMKRFLDLIDAYSAKGAIPRRHFAYLNDRVAMLEGRPQLFGTQFRCDHSTGDIVPHPVQDWVNIDVLREAVGLYPIALYWCAVVQVQSSICRPESAPSN